MAGRVREDLAGAALADICAVALRYITRRDYSALELRRRLLARGADPDLTEEALSALADRGYVDEERFAGGRVRQRRDITRRGRAAIRQELRGLGVAEDVAEQALDSEYPEEEEIRQLELLLEKAEREIAALPTVEQRQKRLLSWERRLIYRGFGAPAVLDAFQRLRGLWGEED